MDVYTYISLTNPRGARAVIDEFGYLSTGDLAECLRKLVQVGGASAVERIMQIHPDRDYFVNETEHYGNAVGSHNACGCNSKKMAIDYFNASGQTEAARYGMQTNTFLLAAAIFIAAAIIVKN